MPTAARDRSRNNPGRRLLPAETPGCSFFLAEHFLEARRDSRAPTNLHGPDEDVNAYLLLRLREFVAQGADPRVVPGLDPLLHGPSPAAGRAACAGWYRANADHRLLCLGLFDRGEALRRRDVPWGMTRTAARRRDLAVAAACYGHASSLLSRGPGRGGAPAVTLAKLAASCEDYVHVLGVLAVRRLGLGARLGEAELAGLLPPPAKSDVADVDVLLAALPADAADIVLDLWLEHARTGDPALRRRCGELAALAGLRLPASDGGAAGRPT